MIPIWHDGDRADVTWNGRPVVWHGRDGGAAERHAQARALVAQLSGKSEETVHFARTPAGAPRVVSPAGWHIGLSQRSGRCLIGMATRPIAVDVEPVDDAPPLWDMLTGREAAELRALPVAERPRAWLRRWTIKEAHAKLVGEPRRLAPEAIATSVIDAVHATATCEGRSRCWTRETGDIIATVALWDEGI